MSYANVLTNSSLVSTLTVSELTVKGSSRSGSGQLNGTTPVDVAVPSILATDVVLITALGAVPANSLPLGITITAGTRFSVVAAVADARLFNWAIVSTV